MALKLMLLFLSFVSILYATSGAGVAYQTCDYISKSNSKFYCPYMMESAKLGLRDVLVLMSAIIQRLTKKKVAMKHQLLGSIKYDLVMQSSLIPVHQKEKGCLTI